MTKKLSATFTETVASLGGPHDQLRSVSNLHLLSMTTPDALSTKMGDALSALENAGFYLSAITGTKLDKLRRGEPVYVQDSPRSDGDAIRGFVDVLQPVLTTLEAFRNMPPRNSDARTALALGLQGLIAEAIEGVLMCRAKIDGTDNPVLSHPAARRRAKPEHLTLVGK